MSPMALERDRPLSPATKPQCRKPVVAGLGEGGESPFSQGEGAEIWKRNQDACQKYQCSYSHCLVVCGRTVASATDRRLCSRDDGSCRLRQRLRPPLAWCRPHRRYGSG